MPTLRALRMLGALESGDMDATELESALAADITKVSDLAEMLSYWPTFRRLDQSVYAPAAIAGSSTAAKMLVSHGAASRTAFANGRGYSGISTAFVASSAAAQAVASDSTLRTLIGTGGASESAVYTAVKGGEVWVTKMMAGLCGQTVSSYSSFLDLYNGNDTLHNAIKGSAPALRFAINSNMVGMAKNDTGTTTANLAPDSSAPVTLVTDSGGNTAKILALAWATELTAAGYSETFNYKKAGSNMPTSYTVNTPNLAAHGQSSVGSLTFSLLKNAILASDTTLLASALALPLYDNGAAGGIQSSYNTTGPNLIGILALQASV